MKWVASAGAYNSYVATHVVQAQYFKVTRHTRSLTVPCFINMSLSPKDPMKMDTYVSKNIFLPDINNEHEVNIFFGRVRRS
jgi:hypothetical protein